MDKWIFYGQLFSERIAVTKRMEPSIYTHDSSVRGSLRQALKHHSEVQALGVPARLNCVQVAQSAYNMQADIARQMALTGGGGAGAKVRSKEPLHEQIAK